MTDDTATPETQPATEPATPAEPKPKAERKPKAKAKPATKKPAKKSKPATKTKKKTAAAMLIEAVLARKGVTHAEACALLKWRQCRPYLFKVCERAGIKLRKEREADGQVRFYGTKPKSTGKKVAA